MVAWLPPPTDPVTKAAIANEKGLKKLVEKRESNRRVGLEVG